jgi:uncharacterized membrane protein (UPF0182 family)
MQAQRRPRLNPRIIAALVVVGVVIAALSSARFYTDVLWFQEVGLTSVLWKTLRTQFLLGLVVGLFTAAVVWGNIALASRLSPVYPPFGMDLEGAGRPDPFSQYREAMRPHLFWVKWAIAGFIGLIAGASAVASWRLVLLWANRTDFGIEDPEFGKDVGFYMFELPLLQQVADWVWFAVMASLLTAAIAHYLYGAIRPERGLRGVSPGAMAHLSVLLGALALIKAYQYWLGTFGLNYSERGTVTGASYTDVNAQLPALRLLAIISIISAVLFLVNIRFRRLALPLAAVGIWVLTAFLAGTVWPFAVQRFSVEPQEPQRERVYIERNLEATRAAFGLSDVKSTNYSATSDLTAEQAEENDVMLQNVRLWDPAVLQRAFEQLQAIRPYYQFEDVDIDRYEVNGEKRQVLLAARELDVDGLPDRSKSWQNVHLQYTHGFGVVASLANSSTTSGQPSFLVREVPGTVSSGADSLEIEQPRLYYGEGFASDEYSIVDTDQPELDFPIEGGVERSSYEGAGGVGIGNIFKKLAFAIREGDPNLILSGLINGDSQILIYRNVRDRVSRAAPFLHYDNDPYAAIVDGRLVWILDAYTSSRWYPYSERFNAGQVVSQSQPVALSGRINYLRNSVKVAVDAYDGTMDFYVVDDEDPLIQAWRGAFPELFTDEDPSPELREHFRYPEDLFRVHREVYRTYHMTDPLDFYSKEDEWEVPPPPTVRGLGGTTVDRQNVIEPVYLLFQPPGETEQRFMLTSPLVPRNRPNMISMMLGSSDPDAYGQVETLLFPRSRVVPGPQQVDNLINQDVEISRTLSLLDQRGSVVEFGSLVTLPIADSLLYIQPIFITAESVGIPELKRVVAVLGQDIVMADSFDDALAEILGVTEGEEEEPDEFAEEEPPEEEEEPPEEVGGELEDLIREAGRLYEEAQEALADGDFASYGRLIEELGQVLEQLSAGASP